MKVNRQRLLYSLIIFILFIVSMGHWIGWNGYETYIYVLCGIVLLYLMNYKTIGKNITKYGILECAVFYISFLVVSLNIRENIFSFVWITQILIFLIPLFAILCISDREKTFILKCITLYFAILMIPAIFLYIVNLIAPIPSLGTIKYSNDIDSNVVDYGIADFHLFFVQSVLSSGEVVSRFQGPFLEPGHLAMMAAFLLLANHHDYHKPENIVLAISILLSFSLAGYVLWLFGFVCCRIYDGSIKFKKVLIFLTIVTIIVLVGLTWHSGDNFIYSAILSRFAYDPDKVIAGNNRSSLNVDYLFIRMFSDIRTFLFGYSPAELSLLEGEANNGFRFFLVRKGFIMLLLVFIPYVLLVMKAKDKKWGAIVFLFICIMFWQRTYPYWFSWIICCDYSIAKLNFNLKVSERK